ncbi:NUDIX hydrolase [Clostridium sediminicola]|uniref:NUDIX domain-containing protein n=1 Tax=Clostridium sediminicola TaxID=3114879 RepID=UPI0031F2447C
MELIREIYHYEIDNKLANKKVKYEIRKAARAILLNDKGEIAILHVTSDKYHKLPGGGIESNETVMKALYREILEEVGAHIKVEDEIGIIIEYRDLFQQLQISYVYLCKTQGELEEPNFTESEKNHGFRVKWMRVEDAISQMQNDEPHNYMGKFINLRDLTLLLKYKNEI